MTMPGVPMVFAGDELGLEGEWGRTRGGRCRGTARELGRALFESYRELIALRRGSAALARGGIRYAAVAAEAVAWLRETADERLLCLAARSAHEPIRLPLAALGCARRWRPCTAGTRRSTGGEAVLPGDGPAFHVWRLEES